MHRRATSKGRHTNSYENPARSPPVTIAVLWTMRGRCVLMPEVTPVMGDVDDVLRETSSENDLACAAVRRDISKIAKNTANPLVYRGRNQTDFF